MKNGSFQIRQAQSFSKYYNARTFIKHNKKYLDDYHEMNNEKI